MSDHREAFVRREPGTFYWRAMCACGATYETALQRTARRQLYAHIAEPQPGSGGRPADWYEDGAEYLPPAPAGADGPERRLLEARRLVEYRVGALAIAQAIRPADPRAVAWAQQQLEAAEALERGLADDPGPLPRRSLTSVVLTVAMALLALWFAAMIAWGWHLTPPRS